MDGQEREALVTVRLPRKDAEWLCREVGKLTSAEVSRGSRLALRAALNEKPKATSSSGAVREEPSSGGIAAWADHANRIAGAECVIDGTAYVPAIEAYCVVHDLQAMQGEGVTYEPRKRRDGVTRWVIAREVPR